VTIFSVGWLERQAVLTGEIWVQSSHLHKTLGKYPFGMSSPSKCEVLLENPRFSMVLESLGKRVGSKTYKTFESKKARNQGAAPFFEDLTRKSTVS
jgi:hypothetical protein